MIKETVYSNYYVDEKGTVYSDKSGILKPLKPFYDSKKRYLYVKINGRNSSVHDLVLGTFKGYFAGVEVNHKNRICSDNRLENLEWVTRKENMTHMYETDSPIRNFKNAKLYNGAEFIGEYKSVTEASKEAVTLFGVPFSMINKHRSYNGVKIITNTIQTDKQFGKRGGYQNVLKGRLQCKPSTTTKENPR